MNTNIEQIKQHFHKVDPIIYEVIKSMDIEVLNCSDNPKDYFKKLCRDIISQQLAGGAAKAIRERFYDLFDTKQFTPKNVMDFSEQELRDVGMSWAKARYVRDLAKKTLSKDIILENLHKLEDIAVINELTKVNGIGNWTAEMFLIFTLGRENIFSHGDLALKKGIQKLYGFMDKPSKEDIDLIINKWNPYKSYGSLALWNSLDN